MVTLRNVGNWLCFHCRPAQIADLPPSEPISVPELFAATGLSDNEEDEDLRMEYPCLSRHPRPAVVSTCQRRKCSPHCVTLAGELKNRDLLLDLRDSVLFPENCHSTGIG